MNVRIHAVAVCLLLSPVWSADTVVRIPRNVHLWRAAPQTETLDLIYGSGGREHAPTGPFRFVKEDLDATSPKFDVIDARGWKWKVKLGLEAQPETAAARFVWAAGYYTADDYYLPEIHVSGLPREIHRGGRFVDADGLMRGARLKRDPAGAKKEGHWKWGDNPFTGTRQLNALRALMAVINNWDVKDVNNAVYEEDGKTIYLVSDLGGTFASPGLAFPVSQAKGNLEQYRKADFICGTSDVEVDFCSPGRPALFRLFAVPQFIRRWKLRWVGHDVPRADARWLGERLGRLSARQIRDAFRAAGYGPDEVEGFALVMERRIGELLEL